MTLLLLFLIYGGSVFGQDAPDDELQQTYTVSGTVVDLDGGGIQGVTMTGLPGDPVTDINGFYCVQVEAGFTGSITPVKDCWVFNPKTRNCVTVMADVPNQDFVGSIKTYVISGAVTDSIGNPLEGVLMQGLPGSPPTDSGGEYVATVPCGWSGTVTPILECYAFEPQNRSYNDVRSSVSNQDFTGNLQYYTVSGTIRDASGNGIPGVTVTGLPGNPVTNDQGFYSVVVECDFVGKITPIKDCYYFNPPTLDCLNVKQDIPNQDFLATLETYQICGTVVDSNGNPLAGVTMNGLPGNPVTGSGGAYCATVPCAWSGCVTPYLDCYVFEPAQRCYENVRQDYQNQDYVGTLQYYTISGTVMDNAGNPIPGVTMTGLPGTPVTDANGFYSGTVPCGWSGCVTPFLDCWVFEPAQRCYQDVRQNFNEEFYTGSFVNYTISGYVRDGAGNAIANVPIQGLPGNPVSNSEGWYSSTVPCNWTGCGTPVMDCVVFEPADRCYQNVRQNYTEQNYTGFIQNYTICGTVVDSNGNPLPGVTMSGLPGNPLTDANGTYCATVPCGWTGCVTPYLDCYVFEPAQRCYEDVRQNYASQDYVGTLQYYTISGTVMDNAGNPIPGVTMTGLPGTPVTDANGFYSGTVPCGWSGCVTPILDCWVFEPSQRCYENVHQNYNEQYYTGTFVNYTISGYVRDGAGNAIANVPIQGLPGNPVSNSEGWYSSTVPCNWTGCGTPVMDCVVFEPAERCYQNVRQNYAEQNYTGFIQNYTICGTVVDSNGNPLQGVTMSGLPGDPVTDCNGSYCDTVPCGWTGCVTPYLDCYVFEPAQRCYENVRQNYQGQNYTGMFQYFDIWGTVQDSGGNPIPGVTMTGLPGTPVTDANGFYSGTVPCGWSGCVMPVLDCWVFEPAERCYENVRQDYGEQYYTGNVLYFSISGYVRDGAGDPIPGVSIDGLPGTPVSNSEGWYSTVVPCGFSGCATPVMDCVDFTPAQRCYTNVRRDYTDQNYTGIIRNYRICGRVMNSNGNALSGVTLSGLPGSPVTGSDGSYCVMVPCGWSGCVTPVLDCYVFEPAQRCYENIRQSQSNQNYVGTRQYFDIWGTVQDSGGNPIPGVTMTGLPGTPVTDANGFYSGTVPCGWSGCVTPVLDCWVFEPAERCYENVRQDYGEQYYTGNVLYFSISGYVRDGAGDPIPGVSIDGLPGTPVSNSDGWYSTVVPCGFSGCATPVMDCVDFTPQNRCYTNVRRNYTDQNYTGIIRNYRICGTVVNSNGNALSGVTMSGLPGSPVTGSQGNYCATVPCGWTGCVTPYLDCYVFEPAQRCYEDIRQNQSNQNYVGTRQYFQISGTVLKSDGLPIPNVTMSGLPRTPVTDDQGFYSATVPCGWSGCVTPVLDCWEFEPAQRCYENVRWNYTDQNYTGHVIYYTISGYVLDGAGNPIANVPISGFPMSVVSNSEGWYSASVPCGFIGCATPALDCVVFEPAQRCYQNVHQDYTDQNYIGYIQNYTICGTVVDSNGNPLPGVTMTGLPGAPLTDAQGNYCDTVPCGWTGCVTPVLDCYIFEPEQRCYNNVRQNYVDQDYAGLLKKYRICGYTLDANEQGIPGVVMNGLPGNPKTDANGQYCVFVPCGWTGTVTPTKPCWMFDPPSRTYENVASECPRDIYIGTRASYTISGFVRDGAGDPITGVTMEGLPGNPVTNSEGFYSAIVECLWSGTVEPKLDCVNFEPASRSYSNVQSNWSNENYTGFFRNYTISGEIVDDMGFGIPGVVVTGLPGNPVTDANGMYMATVPCGFTGTALPQLECWDFEPETRSYVDVRMNKSNQDYIGTQLTFTISGFVFDDQQQPLAGVELVGAPEFVETDINGTYCFDVPCGWTGTITPVLGTWTFTPESRYYEIVTQSYEDQNYNVGTVSVASALIVVTEYGDVWGSPNSGIGPFGTPSRWCWPGFHYDPVPGEGCNNCWYPIIGDVNGDDSDDLIQFTPYGDVWVAENTGACFDNPTRWGWLGFSYSECQVMVESQSILEGKSHGFYPMAEDYNGDGRDDLVQITPFGDVWVATSSGSGFNNPTKWGSLGFYYSRTVDTLPGALPMTGDYNGDGLGDLAQVTPYGDVWVALSTGSGFQDPQRWTSPPTMIIFDPYAGYYPMTADMNGDGMDDVVEITPTGEVLVALSQGNSFSQHQNWGMTGFRYSESEDMLVIVGDVNADMNDDLIQITPNGDPWVATSNGSSRNVSSRWGWIGFTWSRSRHYMPFFIGY